jgi:hypothetical protein
MYVWLPTVLDVAYPIWPSSPDQTSSLRYASRLAFSIVDAITNPQSRWTGSIRGVLRVLELWGRAVNFEAWFSC